MGVTMALVAIGCGLAIRLLPVEQYIAKPVGVALWSFLVFWLVVVMRPQVRVLRAMVWAATLGIGVELLQFTTLPSRIAASFPLSRWVLGTTFAPSDLPAYVAGALVAGAVHCSLRFIHARWITVQSRPSTTRDQSSA